MVATDAAENAKTRRRDYDWGKAKVLFSQGFTSAEIAEELGCTRSVVTSRMRRHGWQQERDEIASTVRNRAIERVVDQMEDQAKRWVGRMVKDIESTMDALDRCPPKPDLRHLGERESVLEKLNRRARLTFGLDNESKTSVQIAFFNQPTKPEAQALEVQEVKPSTEP
jgi:hypothetical protein